MFYRAVCNFKCFGDFESNKEMLKIFLDSVRAIQASSYRTIETSVSFRQGRAYAYGLTETEKKSMKFILLKYVRFYKEA